LAACFLDSMATMQLPAMGYGLRYEYGMFRQTIEGGWQYEQPDNWLRRPDPWEIVRPDDKVEVRLNCSVEVRDGALSPIAGRPSTLIGIPFDRPVVGYGGKTINTLRLWAASVPVEFDFQTFSHGEFISALAGTLAAKSLTRVLYPDDSTTRGQRLRFLQEYFLVACSLADLVRRFRRSNADWSALPDKAAIQPDETRPYGEPRHRGLAQHQWRGGDPLRAPALHHGQRPGRDVPRALQQQDQRRHATSLAAAGEPGARPHHHRGHRQRLDHRPRR